MLNSTPLKIYYKTFEYRKVKIICVKMGVVSAGIIIHKTYKIETVCKSKCIANLLSWPWARQFLAHRHLDLSTVLAVECRTLDRQGKLKRMLSVVSVAWSSLPAISGDLCSALIYAFLCIHGILLLSLEKNTRNTTHDTTECNIIKKTFIIKHVNFWGSNIFHFRLTDLKE